MREQKKKAGESLLARIKKLVDQVLFNPAVPCQEIRHEQLGKFRLGTQGSKHRFLGDGGDHTFFHRRRGRDAQWMPIEAPLAEELARFQNLDHRFLALLGQDSELDPTFLNVKDRIRHVSLPEDVLIFMEFQYLLPRSNFGEKYCGVKHVLVRLL